MSSFSFTIHRLAAKSLIQTKDLGFHETSKGDEKDVVNLSIQSGVLSSFTAFIAINKELNQPVQGPLAPRVIPMPELHDCSRTKGCAVRSRKFCPNLNSFRMIVRYMSTLYEQRQVLETHTFKFNNIS